MDLIVIPYTLLYVSLIMVTITSHIFIISSKWYIFSPVKFNRGSEKNMSFTKISESLKKSEENRLNPLGNEG